jgi:hypothetical protein
VATPYIVVGFFSRLERFSQQCEFLGDFCLDRAGFSHDLDHVDSGGARFWVQLLRGVCLRSRLELLHRREFAIHRYQLVQEDRGQGFQHGDCRPAVPNFG